MGIGFLQCGKLDGESAAFTRYGFDRQNGIMTAQNPLHDGKAEATAALGAGARRDRRGKTLAQMGNVFGRNAFAIVMNRQNDMLIPPLRRDQDQARALP